MVLSIYRFASCDFKSTDRMLYSSYLLFGYILTSALVVFHGSETDKIRQACLLLQESQCEVSDFRKSICSNNSKGNTSFKLSNNFAKKGKSNVKTSKLAYHSISKAGPEHVAQNRPNAKNSSLKPKKQQNSQLIKGKYSCLNFNI